MRMPWQLAGFVIRTAGQGLVGGSCLARAPTNAHGFGLLDRMNVQTPCGTLVWHGTHSSGPKKRKNLRKIQKDPIIMVPISFHAKYHGNYATSTEI